MRNDRDVKHIHFEVAPDLYEKWMKLPKPARTFAMRRLVEMLSGIHDELGPLAVSAVAIGEFNLTSSRITAP
jgi:hypothetical protein